MAHDAPLEGVPPLPADVEKRFDYWVGHKVIPFLSKDYPQERAKALAFLAQELSTARKQGADAERERIVSLFKHRIELEEHGMGKMPPESPAWKQMQETVDFYESVIKAITFEEYTGQ